uniref:Ground-like domain-containing protein n=1 Tax=Globodera rostochiensis TaxID=31243 RepID=A0A914ICV9_GLORO
MHFNSSKYLICMPQIMSTIIFSLAIITFLTTANCADAKKILKDGDLNLEIDNEAIDEPKMNSTRQMIQQLFQQLQQIQQKFLLLQKSLSQGHVQAVQPAVDQKLNTKQTNSSVPERKSNANVKAHIKQLRDRLAAPARINEQFRKLARVKDQPQTHVPAPSFDKTVKEVSHVRPVPVAKPMPLIQPSNQPQQLPLAFTHQPWLDRTYNQTQPTAHIVDKETPLSNNSSAAVKCPKVEWHKIMERAIKSDDPNTSIKQIQAELSRTEHGIFVVMCSLSNQREQFTKNLKLKGDDFCQLIKDNVWCHAAGLSLKNSASIQIGR